MVRSYITLFIVLIVFCFSYSANCEPLFKEFCEDYEFECGSSGGRLVFYTSGDPKSFNPVVSQEKTTSDITNFFFEGLTTSEPLTLEVVPSLAK